MLITNIKELETKKRIKTYSCGSQRLSHAIRTELGMVPVNVYKHEKTGKIINVFVLTNELSAFLTKWTNNNPKKVQGVQNE